MIAKDLRSGVELLGTDTAISQLHRPDPRFIEADHIDLEFARERECHLHDEALCATCIERIDDIRQRRSSMNPLIAHGTRLRRRARNV